MKIYISADMEGISGIVSHAQTMVEGRDYERARYLMTREVNAVVEALIQHGATEVVVNDSHNNMDNILIEEFHPGAVLISGSPKPLSMMQGIDESFDAVFFVGYHARPGITQAIIDHTYVYRVLEAKINGKPMSEAGLNGRLAGYYGVPVALVTGDQKTILCAREELYEPVGVAVKEAIGRNSARIYPFNRVKELLNTGVAEAIKKLKSLQPTVESGSIELEVTFYLAEMAEMTLLIPGVRRKGGRTVCYTSDNYLELFKAFRAMLIITSAIK
ncbi:MAG: D-amino peptidase [Halanaerobiales bacterium]|nr:D-amino peptidase [Halanaerobiales bacterium]